MLKITEHEYRQKLKQLAAELKEVTMLYISDRPGLVRETGISINPNFKAFTASVSCYISADEECGYKTVVHHSEYWAGGVNCPSLYLSEKVSRESEDLNV